MFRKANIYLDTFLKGISAAFVLAFIAGLCLIYRYLNVIGMESEIRSVLISKNVIVFSAFLAFLFAFGIFLIFLLAPYFLRYFLIESDDIWVGGTDKKNISSWLAGPLVLSSILYVNFTIFCIDNQPLGTLGVAIFSFIQFLFLSKVYGGIRGESGFLRFLNFIFNYLFFFLLNLVLFFVLYFAVISFESLITDNYILIIYIIVFSILYVGSVVISCNGNIGKFVSIVPITVFSLLIVGAFSYEKSYSIISSSLELGSYQSSFIIEDKYSHYLSRESGFITETIEAGKSVLLKDVWVLLNLEDKLIVSGSEFGEIRYSFPRAAILGEIE